MLMGLDFSSLFLLRKESECRALYDSPNKQERDESIK
jgi:hypothetical protein